MINHKEIIIVLSILLLLFITILSCQQKSPTNEETFNALLKKINDEREEFQKKTPPKVEDYIDELTLSNDVFDDYELKSILPNFNTKPFDGKRILTNKEALEDVEMLFKLFKYAYAPYKYFGGDNEFNKAKQDIISEINNRNGINNIDFLKLLKSKLTFIKDGHFFIGSRDELKVYYSYKEVYFLKDEKGFYKNKNNKKYYIESIDSNENIDDFMKPNINDEGRLAHAIGFTKASPISIDETRHNYNALTEELPIKIIYKSNWKEYEEVVSFKTEKRIEYDKKDSFKLEVKNNIPVVVFNKIDTDVTTNEIDETVDKLKEYGLYIIDLRGNGGGSTEPGDYFCEKMGIPKFMKANYVYLHSKPILRIEQYLYGKIRQNGNATLNKYGIKQSPNDEIPIEESNKLTIVLIDRMVASSGEGFIRDLCSMKNVILVGTNTQGTSLALNSYPYDLPNSNIRTNLGAGIFFCADIDKFELNGFTPDIWVDSNESLDKVIKFINFYGLNIEKQP